MKLAVFPVLLLLRVGGCLAQRPEPCSTPPEYQGRFTLDSPKLELNMLGRYVYDSTRKRIYFGDISHYKNETTREDVLLLYQEGVMYKMDMSKRTCQKQKLAASFQPMQIPSDAKFIAQVVLGTLAAPGQGLLINTWFGEVPTDKVEYVINFTDLGCLPVSAVYKTPQSGWIFTSYFDNVLGIKDPEKLIPPDFCQDAALDTQQEGNFFSLFF